MIHPVGEGRVNNAEEATYQHNYFYNIIIILYKNKRRLLNVWYISIDNSATVTLYDQ